MLKNLQYKRRGEYRSALTLMILLILLILLYACAPRPQQKFVRKPENTAVPNLMVKKSSPPPAMTIPRGDEPLATTFFQEKLNDPEGKKDACKQYFLTITQDKFLWDWLRQNC
jgi:hypothetical protein